jgi:hypothetical protein
MVSRTVQNCQQIMRALVGDGFTHQISKWELKKYITVFRGGDPRTIKNCIRNLMTLEYLSQVNVSVFRIELAKVNGLLEKAIKDGGQKKLV